MKTLATQADHPVRIVAVENLRAMCANASAVAHRFWVEKVSRSRVHIGYSNPNEYGTESPMFIVFPCIPNDFGDRDNPLVVLSVLNVIHDNWNGEGWQAFDPMLRQYATRDPDGKWRVVPFDTVDLFGRQYVLAQHIAYHGPNGCEVCTAFANQTK